MCTSLVLLWSVPHPNNATLRSLSAFSIGNLCIIWYQNTVATGFTIVIVTESKNVVCIIFFYIVRHVTSYSGTLLYNKKCIFESLFEKVYIVFLNREARHDAKKPHTITLHNNLLNNFCIILLNLILLLSESLFENM